MKDAKFMERQKRFIDYYIITGGNGAKSARLAGYDEKNARQTAYKILQLPGVKEMIIERQKQLEDERIADIKEIKSYWTSVMRGQVTEMCFKTNGKEYERDARINARLRASEDLAKAHGAFLKGASEPEVVDIVWVDDYGEESDYNKFEELSE